MILVVNGFYSGARQCDQYKASVFLLFFLTSHSHDQMWYFEEIDEIFNDNSYH